MLRGRHRGLPVAIDRAVMLPLEFQKSDDDFADERSDHPSETDHTAPANRRNMEDESSINDEDKQQAAWRRSTDEARLEHARRHAAKEDLS